MYPQYTPKQLESFWSKVAIAANPGKCWEWLSPPNDHGYGQKRWDKRMIKAHRLAWLLTNGGIPEGLEVCHSCDNRKCCNPAHLFLGTQLDNMHDMASKGRSNQPKGERNGRCKLTDQQVDEIRQRHSKGDVTYTALGHDYHVSCVQISRIVNRKNRA